MRLVLASASPRRRELLTQAGYDFVVHAADVDESLRLGEGAAAYVQRLAEEKAQAVLAVLARLASPQQHLVVLGADTTVVCDGAAGEEILGKPIDAAEAQRMVRRLSGRWHKVLTAVAVACDGRLKSVVETTDVLFASIPEEDLCSYCATPEPLDKAGAYGIQGYAARWIPRIEGCYFNVMGLPIARTVQLIEWARTPPRG